MSIHVYFILFGAPIDEQQLHSAGVPAEAKQHPFWVSSLGHTLNWSPLTLGIAGHIPLQSNLVVAFSLWLNASTTLSLILHSVPIFMPSSGWLSLSQSSSLTSVFISQLVLHNSLNLSNVPPFSNPLSLYD